MLRFFWNDESGFVVSSELVLVATIVVIGLIVGLVEVNYSIVGELNDVSESIGSLNQSYFTTGITGLTSTSATSNPKQQTPVPPGGTAKAQTAGSIFRDNADACDGNECTLGCDAPTAESPKS